MNFEILVASFILSVSLMLKDIFKNLFAGIWLTISPEFHKGDMVEFDKWKGEIIKFTIRNIHIKLDDGRVLIKESSEFLEMDVVRKRKK